MAVLIKAAGRQIGLSTKAGGPSLQSSLAIFFTMKEYTSDPGTYDLVRLNGNITSG